MTLSDHKYKDELPLRTINKIRNILLDLNILVVESGWKNSVNGFYSVSVRIKNTEITANGKGTSPEYALASAYAELMERLQNQAFFRIDYDLRDATLAYQDFFYAPDEKFISIEDFFSSNEEWAAIQLNKTPNNINIQELLKKWQQVSYEKVPADFIALPYLNINSGHISHIPIKMISKLYLSNGMCAGNTNEEALVQGLCEVLERYVNIRILVDEITPPDIPREYLNKHPTVWRMIHEIEKSGNFEVIMKDCSLGQGFPVVGVIFINKDDQSYFVKFGCHPIFSLAAERALTELLQGKDIRAMKGVKEFCYKPLVKEHENLLGILINGSGYYPAQLFKQKYSYGFTEFLNLEVNSNSQLLEHLLNLIKKSGYQIFVRDNSFLDFPSFHIIVPGMSEIEQFFDIKLLDEYVQYNNTKKYLRKLPQISLADADELIKFLPKMPYPYNKSPLIGMLNLVIKKGIPWYYIGTDVFISVLYYLKGDFANAYYVFDRFLDSAQSMRSGEEFNLVLLSFLKCIRDYFGACADGMQTSDIIYLLSKFYPIAMVEGIINEFTKKDQLFNIIGYLPCWCCEKCNYKDDCSYIESEKIYKILKKKYAERKIEQKILLRLKACSGCQ